jgi:hypothetical protein
MVHNKAQPAGQSGPLFNPANAVVGHLWGSDITNQYQTVH